MLAGTMDGWLADTLARFQAEAQGRTLVSQYRGSVAELLGVYTWYCSPEQLLEKLLNSDDGGDPEGHGRAVCCMLRYWLLLRPADWQRPGLLQAWAEYLDGLKACPVLALIYGDVERWRVGGSTYDVMELPVKVLAEQLTVLMHENMAAIGLEEFRAQGWLHSDRADQSARILHVLRTHSNLGLWVGAMVLARPTPLERAAVLGRFVLLGEALLALGNYDGLFAVTSALAAGPVRRLRDTWSMAGPEVERTMHVLETACNPANNYAEYRHAVKQLPGHAFFVPYMALLLKDVASALATAGDDEATPHAVWQLLGCFVHSQRVGPWFDRDRQLCTLLRVVLEASLSWDELHQRSLACEGQRRDSTPVQTTGNVFYEVQQLSLQRSGSEAATLAREVERLVAIIFATYDLNNDNMLEEHEYKNVLASFPFLGEFCAIDQDGDGSISREELRQTLRTMSRAPDLAGTDTGLAGHEQGMEVLCEANDQRYFTLHFHMADGTTHTVITRYSAVLRFHKEMVETGLVRMAAPCKFPPKHYFPWQLAGAVIQRREFFAEYFADISSNPSNWQALVEYGFLPQALVGGSKRRSTTHLSFSL